MDITRAVLKQIANEIEAADQGVAKKHGINISRPNATTDLKTASMKIIINSIAADGEVITPESVDLKRFHPELVNKKIAIGSRTFTIVGYKSQNWKKPFIMRENKMGGKTFKCDESTIDQAIARMK